MMNETLVNKKVVVLKGIFLTGAVADGLLFGQLFTTQQIVLGTSVKMFIVIMFAVSYWYSKSCIRRPAV